MADWMKEDAALEDLFAAARRAGPEPSGAWLARVMEAAEAEQAACRGVDRARVQPAADGGGLWALVMGVFGGWGALGGMLTATVAGIWIGFAGADRLDLVTGRLLGSTENLGTVVLLPDADLFALSVVE
ncbi:MAG: dihydroorotate dehydrogenase [Sphingomonadales bacterium]|nr:dihydroorotate dehydrogenase [Sphingomonadales bacterium]